MLSKNQNLVLIERNPRTVLKFTVFIYTNQTTMANSGFVDFPCSNRGAQLVVLKKKSSFKSEISISLASYGEAFFVQKH